MMQSNERFGPTNALKLVVGAIVGVCAIVLFLSTYYNVAQYERAVLTRFGKFVEVSEPGLHFKIPFMNSVKYYRTDLQSLQPAPGLNKGWGISAYTVDNQEVHVIFTVQYRIIPSKVAHIYENVQDLEIRLYQIAEDRVKAELGKVNTSHVAESRGKVRDGIKKVLHLATEGLGIEVVDFQLNNIEYDDTFKKAVQAAAAARAGVETQENLRLQAVKTAEAVVVRAKGVGDAAREQAKGEADGIKLRGDAQASAIKAQAEALAANAKLVELRKAEKWDGKLPVWMGTGPMPLMQVEAPK